MKYPIYQVDAFTSEIFKGNPAAIVPLEAWLPDDVMQNIAIENNLSETAFFILDGDNFYLRWFTPTYEIDLCGHATLATSFIIMTELYPERTNVLFKTNEAGDLIVTKEGDKFTMNFPSRPGDEIDIKDIPEIVLDGIGNITPIAAYKSRDLMLVFEDEEIITNIKPNFSKLKNYTEAVCVTAPSNQNGIDFVSRFFCAYDETIPEDPVTGSAHCTLTPYWSKALKKSHLSARQISGRSGDLLLEMQENRVYITGQARLYMKGSIYV